MITTGQAEIIAHRIANLKYLADAFMDDDPVFEEHKRYNPFYSELNGTITLAKLLGADIEFEYDEDINPIGVTVDGVHRTISRH